MTDYIHTSIALLTGSAPMQNTPYFGPGPSPVNAKVLDLKRRGHEAVMQDIPGLWRVDNGPEITTNQLLSL